MSIANYSLNRVKNNSRRSGATNKSYMGISTKWDSQRRCQYIAKACQDRERSTTSIRRVQHKYVLYISMGDNTCVHAARRLLCQIFQASYKNRGNVFWTNNIPKNLQNSETHYVVRVLIYPLPTMPTPIR